MIEQYGEIIIIDASLITANLAWPVTMLVAWLAGEYGYRWLKLPRISVYAAVGFILAPMQSGFLPIVHSSGALLLANIAFGLILFETGYRINLHWLKTNSWIWMTSVFESFLTFFLVFGVVQLFGLPNSTAALLAALAMASSPASILRVINEQRSSGQLTERLLHFSAMNSVIAVFVFKVIIGLVIFKASGSVMQAAYSSLLVLLLSVVPGVLMGAIMPFILGHIKHTMEDSTLVFTIAVIFLVVLSHNLNLSPVLSTLAFGLVARHRREVLNSSQRGFGSLGDILSIFLFVYVASTLEWQQVVAGAGLGIAIILVRQLAKVGGITALAYISGISWYKGLLVGIGMAPLSVFVILVLEQTRNIGIGLTDQLAPLAACALAMEIFGPILTRLAIIWAKESRQ